MFRSVKKMLVGGPTEKKNARIINATGSDYNDLLSVALAGFNHLSDAHGSRHYHPPFSLLVNIISQ